MFRLSVVKKKYLTRMVSCLACRESTLSARRGETEENRIERRNMRCLLGLGMDLVSTGKQTGCLKKYYSKISK